MFKFDRAIKFEFISLLRHNKQTKVFEGENETFPLVCKMHLVLLIRYNRTKRVFCLHQQFFRTH